MSSRNAAATRSRSRSSILSRIDAPYRRASPAVNEKDRIFPMCRYPLGVGAILVLTKFIG